MEFEQGKDSGFVGEGHIPGAVRIGNMWAIPQNAKKPTDARIKSGKYVKNPKLKDQSGKS